jgi:hypothetical protein
MKSRSRANGTVDKGLGGVSRRSEGAAISQVALSLVGFLTHGQMEISVHGATVISNLEPMIDARK